MEDRNAMPTEAMVDWDNPNDPVVKLFVGYDVESYVEEYELCGDGGDYAPNEQEKTILVDAIYGVVSDLHEKLRALSAAQKIAIKPLDWVNVGESPRCITVCGMYAIHPSSGPYGQSTLTLTGIPGNSFGKFKSLEAAKAAAQADFEQRIRSALALPLPVQEPSVDQIRAAYNKGWNDSLLEPRPFAAARKSMGDRYIGTLSPFPSIPEEKGGTAESVLCPCTTFEQDEDCIVGYPSLLCSACDGTGNAPIDKVVALAAEMLKVAEQVDELEDPFTAWESIDLIKSQMAKASAAKPAIDAALTAMNRCVHDGGFDREIGPIGCGLGDKCVCIGVYPKVLAVADALRASPTEGQTVKEGE